MSTHRHTKPELMSSDELVNTIEKLLSHSRSSEKEGNSIPKKTADTITALDTLFNELAERDLKQTIGFARNQDHNEIKYPKTTRYLSQKASSLQSIYDQLYRSLHNFSAQLAHTAFSENTDQIQFNTAKLYPFVKLKYYADSNDTRSVRKVNTLVCYQRFLSVSPRSANQQAATLRLHNMARKAFANVACEICTERDVLGASKIVLDNSIINELFETIAIRIPAVSHSAQRALGEIYGGLSRKDLKTHMKKLYANGEPPKEIHEVAQHYVPFSVLPWSKRFDRLEALTRPSKWRWVGHFFTPDRGPNPPC